MKTFLEEIVTTSNKRETDIEALKNNGGAIVSYGAGSYALGVEKFLNSYGLTVDAFFVDDEYLNSKSNVAKNIITFSEVSQMFDKFSVVIANITAVTDTRKRLKQRDSKQIIGVYLFDCLFLEVFSHFNFEYIRKHIKKFEAVYHSLSDEQSKKTYIGFINTKITHNSDLLGTFNKDQYFCEDIVKLSNNEVFVDGGAFTGDTLLPFIEKTNGRFYKYYAFEPDAENASKLKDLIKGIDISGIASIQKGLWSKPEILRFSGDGIDSGSISEYGDKEILVDSIDNLCPDATFIKMDIEGAELEALKGAAETIKKNQPKLAICIYHRPEHLFEVPIYIKSLCLEYKFYIRQHRQEISGELVLYAII
ncbi:MAG: FkbM family methyltransferase [Bacteroidales bacterium]